MAVYRQVGFPTPSRKTNTPSKQAACTGTTERAAFQGKPAASEYMFAAALRHKGEIRGAFERTAPHRTAALHRTAPRNMEVL